MPEAPDPKLLSYIRRPQEDPLDIPLLMLEEDSTAVKEVPKIR